MTHSEIQMKPTKRDRQTFSGLRRIIATLRGPEGCPWDRVQTHETLRPYLLEEASETLAALDEGDPARLREELGDLLLEVLLHVQIAEENGDFRMDDVVSGVAEKLVRRHPHVFEDAVAETPEAVVEQWDEIKRRERGDQSALTGIPLALPALAYAQAVQRRAAGAGFAFESSFEVWEALMEELDELRRADTPEKQRGEIGDVLFALANVARYLDADAEDALRQTSRGFTRRFQRVEELARERGLDLRDAEMEQKLALWEEAKELPSAPNHPGNRASEQ
ncbi:MAG: nucleoside triphosphate pyrophosphohydrolase [Dehalococcoidia bacterium]|nr:nucleoside triphosphate pyrophosphohydrolase [Dehalococcoidia bacterium]